MIPPTLRSGHLYIPWLHSIHMAFILVSSLYVRMYKGIINNINKKEPHFIKHNDFQKCYIRRK